MNMIPVNPNECYKHYKGGLYYFLYESTHTETGEMLAIYTDGNKTWARPWEMFFGYVEVDSEKVRRFKPISMSSNN